jgi:hypothetical protein
MGMDANIFRPLQRRDLDFSSNNGAALILGQLASIEAKNGVERREASEDRLAKRQDANEGARMILGQLVGVRVEDDVLTTLKKMKRQGA